MKIYLCVFIMATCFPIPLMAQTEIEEVEAIFDWGYYIDDWRLDKVKSVTPAVFDLAQKGDARAQYLAGKISEDSHLIERYVDKKAVESWFIKSAEQGYSKAQYELATIYGLSPSAIGTHKNTEKSNLWYQKAAANGHAEAQYALGELISFGDVVSKNKKTEAAFWYKKSAIQGNQRAIAALGRVFYISDEKALEFAAENGSAYAMRVLGYKYKVANGVTQDYEKALTWLTRASENNESTAQWMLGEMLRDGLGTDKDYAGAMHWFRLSADKDERNARIFIGKMYESGEGVPQDRVVAYAAFKVASKVDRDHEEKKRSDAFFANAIFNIAVATGRLSGNDMGYDRDIERLKKDMSWHEIRVAERLNLEMEKHGQFIIAMDRFLNDTKP